MAEHVPADQVELLPVRRLRAVQPDEVFDLDDEWPDDMDESAWHGPLMALVDALLADLRDAAGQMMDGTEPREREVGKWLRAKVAHHALERHRLGR